MSIDKFMKDNKPLGLNRSKLDQYEEAIATLLSKKYSVPQIHTYLHEYENVNISIQMLYRYVKKLKINPEAAVQKKEISTKTAPAKTTIKQEPQKAQEFKIETPDEIMARVGSMVKKSREDSTGAKIEQWEPSKKLGSS